MKAPEADLRIFESLQSTQDEALNIWRNEKSAVPVAAFGQTQGRGRLGRQWWSPAGTCLALSVPMSGYIGAEKPWLIGMSAAVAVAGAVHCRLQWPNDLVIDRKKVGGILVEVKEGLPIVGIGLNLMAGSYPAELADSATSLEESRGHADSPEKTALMILKALRSAPEPADWHEIEPVWRLFDDTPGKRFTLASGESATAVGIGPDGQLVCSVEGEITSVYAAESVFGHA